MAGPQPKIGGGGGGGEGPATKKKITFFPRERLRPLNFNISREFFYATCTMTKFKWNINKVSYH